MELNITPSPGPPPTFQCDTTSIKPSLLTLRQDISTYGLAGKIWDAAYALDLFLRPFPPSGWIFNLVNPIPTGYFLPNDAPTKSYRILEIGSGTGYLGISLAQRLNRACEVYLTDLEEVLPLLRHNVLDCVGDDHLCARIKVEKLHWGDILGVKNFLANLGGSLDLVLISDCIYYPELFEPLLTTLREVCSYETDVVVGHKIRCLEWESTFWEEGFGKIFEFDAVRFSKEIETKDENEAEQNNKKVLDMTFLGEEEDIFVFLAKKSRKEKARGDDTFATLMLYKMDVNGLQI